VIATAIGDNALSNRRGITLNTIRRKPPTPQPSRIQGTLGVRKPADDEAPAEEAPSGRESAAESRTPRDPAPARPAAGERPSRRPERAAKPERNERGPRRDEGAKPARREDGAKPARGDRTPRTPGTAPRDQERTPRTPGAAPRDQEHTPRTQGATPRDKERTPRTPSAAPRDKERTPRTPGAAARDQERAPRGDFAPRRSAEDRAPRGEARPPRRDGTPARGADERAPRRESAQGRRDDERAPRRDFSSNREDAGRAAPRSSGPQRTGEERPQRRESAPERRGDQRPSPPAAATFEARAASAAAIAEAAQARAAVEGVRLSKLMAERGLCSRREADEFIERGWVFVDGRRVSELGVRVGQDARVTLAPEATRTQQQRATILLHKPVGYVSGQPEPGYSPAVSLIGPDNQADRDVAQRFHPSHLKNLAPAGRLDIDSTGLLVLTQDGRIARQLIGEDSKVEKEYIVRVEGTLAENGLALLNHGLWLDDRPLRPAEVEWINDDQLRFVLREGRKRQIRRMCELVGLKVVGLKRVRIGHVKLGDLPLGQWRFLREDERFG